MMREILAAMLLLSAGSATGADYLLLLDPTRLDRAVAAGGAGPDGRQVRPAAIATACLRDGVFGPAAFSPERNACRAVAALPGLSELMAGLRLAGDGTHGTALDQVNGGGIVAALPSRRLACIPGDCSRELFDGAGYPTNLVGRPDPAPLPVPSIAEFTIQPTGIVAGQTATLSWAAAEVAVCQLASSENNEVLSVPPSGQLQLMPSSDIVWTLACAGPGGTAIAQATATVDPAPGAPEILLFTASRDDVPIGAQTRLIWEASDASACEISNGEQLLSVPVRGSLRVPVADDTVFELRCQNAIGSASSRTGVLVTTATEPPVISVFSIDRSTIERGDNTFLTWRAPGATRCRLREPGRGFSWRLPSAGQIKLVPASSRTYAVDCRNAFGAATAQTTVTVADQVEPLRITAFSLDTLGAAPNQASGNGTARLAQPGLINASWTTEGAQACRIADDRGRALEIPPNGSRIVRIEETTALQIICAARGAEAQAFGQVEVIQEFLFADDFEAY